MLATTRLLLLAGLAAWALAGLGIETAGTIAAVDSADSGGRPPTAFWRPGTAPPAHLAAFVEGIGDSVPAGSVVVFATGDGGGGAEFFQSLWAAYLLPRHRVIPLAHRRARSDGEYLAAYRTTIDHPRAVAPRELPGGVLYRIAPP